MIDKIVLLAAGKGTRMLKLSQNKPKHLIQVNGRPFLYHLLKRIQRAGFKKIILIIGYKKEKMYRFAENYKHEFDLKLVDQFKILGKTRYGTACPVECAANVIKNENFVVSNGDDMFSLEDFKRIRKFDDKFCYASGTASQHPESFGIFIIKNNFLKKIKEKPKPGIDFNPSQADKYLVNAGLYKFTSDIFKAIQRIKVSPRGEYELTDAINLLAKDNKVKIYKLQKDWLTFSQPEDVAKMGKHLNPSITG